MGPRGAVGQPIMDATRPAGRREALVDLGVGSDQIVGRKIGHLNLRGLLGPQQITWPALRSKPSASSKIRGNRNGLLLRLSLRLTRLNLDESLPFPIILANIDPFERDMAK